MPAEGLRALKLALVIDDPRLVQRMTTNTGERVVAACAVGYCGWKGEGLETVDEVDEFFAGACLRCDEALGEPAACRHFYNWYDDVPRDEMRRGLAAEVDWELTKREAVPHEDH